MFIKKLIVFASFLSSPFLLGMEEKALMPTLVQNRSTLTIEASKQICNDILGNVQEFIAFNPGLAVIDKGFTNLQLNELQGLVNSILNNPDFFKNLFRDIQKIIFKQIKKMDANSYNKLNRFVGSMDGYLNQFLACKDNNEVEILLQRIKISKEDIIKDFYQCSPIVMELGKVCGQAIFNYLVKNMPENALPYLALGSDLAQQTLQKFGMEFNDFAIPALQKSFELVGRGYLDLVLIGIKIASKQMGFEVDPIIDRIAYFMKGLANIFFCDKQMTELPMITMGKATFPLNDIYFKETDLNTLCTYAFKGALKTISIYCQAHPESIDVLNDNDNLLSYAIRGYFNGQDLAWGVIAFLLNRTTLEVSDSVAAMLENVSNNEDVNWRKKAIAKMLMVRRTFYLENSDGYFEISSDAPQKPVVSKNALVSVANTTNNGNPNQGCIIS